MPEPDRGKHLILVGLPGAGKSSAGRLLAQRLKVGFIELDDLIERREKMSIVQIFARGGEKRFRDSESRALESLRIDGPSVISVGGGAVEKEENRARLRELGRIVWLRLEAGDAAKRAEIHTRPLLSNAEDPFAELALIARRRDPLYAGLCDEQINANQPIEVVVDELQRLWHAR